MTLSSQRFWLAGSSRESRTRLPALRFRSGYQLAPGAIGMPSMAAITTPARTLVPACCRGDFSITSRTRTPSPVQAGSGKKPSAAVESASGRVGR